MADEAGVLRRVIMHVRAARHVSRARHDAMGCGPTTWPGTSFAGRRPIFRCRRVCSWTLRRWLTCSRRLYWRSSRLLTIRRRTRRAILP